MTLTIIGVSSFITQKCSTLKYISHFLSIISVFCMRLSYIIKTHLI